jgi:DNA-binding MarR family transcriptional regulator
MKEILNDFVGSAHIFASAVNDLMEMQLCREVGQDLSFSQLKLLKLVSIKDADTISDVAAFLGVSNTAAGKAVDKLVRRDLVHRTEAPADRRAFRLSLTEEGRRILTGYDAAKSRVLEEVIGQFPPEELIRAANLLDRLSLGIVNLTASEGELCLQCGIYFREKCLMRNQQIRTCFWHRQRNGGNDPEKTTAGPAGK